MNIIITANMGNGTIQAKLEPLSRVEKVKNIYFLRKKPGPIIPKVKYITLPPICRFSFFNITLTPILLTFYVIRLKCSFIISYHIIPHAFFAAFASSISRKPYFVCQTGLIIQTLANNKLFWQILKLLFRKARAICVPGSQSEDFWISKGVTPQKIIRLHSTADTEYYSFNLNKERKYEFIYIGRLSKEKRVDFLIKAFSYVNQSNPDTKLVIVGDGPLLKNMKSYAKSLNLEEAIHFAGFQKEVLPWLNLSDIILLSSETEGLPCAVMEAMSVGLIPITTNVGNLPDIIKHGETGFLVNKKDIKGFARYMLYAITLNHAVKDSFSQNARALIMSHHSHNVSQRTWDALLW